MIQQQEELLLNLPKDIFQNIARFLDATDFKTLCLICHSLNNSVQKTPQYIGSRNKQLFFNNVKKQKALLFKQLQSGDNLLSQLCDPRSDIKLRYTELQKLQNGDLNFTSDSEVINKLNVDIQNNFCDLLPLIAALKLETIKDMPAESKYFLNIQNEETNFDYSKGYSLITLLSVLGTLSGITTAASLGATFVLSSAAMGIMLPYLCIGASATIACFAIAGHYGTQHQRGLNKFVLDDTFLQSNSECKPAITV